MVPLSVERLEAAGADDDMMSSYNFRDYQNLK